MTNEQVSPYLAMPDGERYRQLLLKDAEIERLRADISQAYDLRDKAEGWYCTALMEIDRLRAIITDIVKDGGDDPNSHAYLGEAMLQRIGASDEPEKQA